MGKLTASNFGKAIASLYNPHPINVRRLRDDIYTPRDLSNIPAIRWGLEHEKPAIDAYVKKTKAIYKPTGFWFFPNGHMGASPDGLIFQKAHDRDPIGIIEVKCPYSMREVSINCYSEWHTYLKYLDCHNNLKTDSAYYHQIQGTMFAVDVTWCDFVIWTPHNMRIDRIRRDPAWGQRYLGKLEEFYNEHLRRTEDKSMDWETVQPDNDDDTQPFLEPTRDVNCILHPQDSSCEELRFCMVQTLQYHIARRIYETLSYSRSGVKWPEAVSKYWDDGVEQISETCLGPRFRHFWFKKAKAQSRKECADIFSQIIEEDCIWSSLLYDPDFVRIVRSRVRSYEPFYATRMPACTCPADPPVSTLYVS